MKKLLQYMAGQSMKGQDAWVWGGGRMHGFGGGDACALAQTQQLHGKSGHDGGDPGTMQIDRL